jgi:hypothetical protein
MSVREQADLHPNSKIELGARENGNAVIRAVVPPATSARSAFARLRGTAKPSQFKSRGTGEFMAFLQS